MRIVAFAAALALSAVAAASAQTAPPAAAPARNDPTAGRDKVDTMFRDRRASADWFTRDLLVRTSLADIDAAISRISTQLGSYNGVDGTNGDYTAHFEQGVDEVFVHLNGDDKIDYLVFRSPIPKGS